MIAIMRGAVKGAGNPRKLLLVVECADPPAVYEAILDRYSQRTGVGRRGGETHLLLAKAMGFLDYRNAITIDAGRTFLVLSEIVGIPKEFLLMQLLRKDRSFLIPFLSVFSEAKDRTMAMARKCADHVLGDLWNEYPDDLDSLGFQRDQHRTEYGLAHFINPRFTLLRRIGAGEADIQKRLATEFEQFVNQPLPPNSYSLLARALYRKEPMHFIPPRFVKEAYSKLKGISYASIVGLYDYLNQRTIPGATVDYDRLFHFLRNSDGFDLHPMETLREGLFRMRAAS